MAEKQTDVPDFLLTLGMSDTNMPGPSVVVALLLLAIFLTRSLRLLSATKSWAGVGCAYAVALRSALIYVAMAVPMLVFTCSVSEAAPDGKVREVIHSWGSCPKSPYKFIPTNLMRVYHWLPFWYAFLVATHVGTWIAYVRQALKGLGIALVAMCLMNYLMPGGASVRYQELESLRGRGWFPGGYRPGACLAFSLLFVYGIFFYKGTTGTKQYALCIFSGLIVPFMNPETNTGFRAVLWDWDFTPNLDGPVMCDAWLILLAVFCSIFALGSVPCSRASREKRTCMANASKALAALAQDTKGCMEWLLTNFLQSSLHFDVESSFLVIRRLGSRRTAIEALLTQAEWECCVGASREQLRILWMFSDLLRHLRQLLRVQLELGRSHGRMTTKSCNVSEVSEHLNDFLISCGDALSILAAHCECAAGLSEKVCGDVLVATSRADQTLILALEELVAKRDKEGINVTGELAFVERLRSWPSLIDNMIQQSRGNVVVKQAAPADTSDNALALRKRHLNAVRNTISWLVALWWCISKRDYSSGCVVSTSLIFSATSGSSFDTNINRMLGIGLGLAVGNVPAILVMQGTVVDGYSNQFLQCVTIYFVIMFIMWTIAMYGYLATGSKYSSACLLWVGNAGTQMLKHIQTFDRTRGLFLDVLDNFLSCLIVFFVDQSFAYLFGMSTSEEMNVAVCKCIEDTALIVDSLSTKKVMDVDITVLSEHIKTARFWNEELRKEGLVWNTLWDKTRHSDAVPFLLDRCDEVYLAVYAMQMSAQRCSSDELASEVTREVIHGNLSGRCLLLHRATRAMLAGEELDSEIRSGLSSLTQLQKNSESSDAEGDLGTPSMPVDVFDRAYEDDICKRPALLDLRSTQPAAVVTSEAAAMALKVSAISFRIALRRIGGSLAAQVALTSKDWRAAHRVSLPPSSSMD